MKVRKIGESHMAFRCPGCGYDHVLPIGAGDSPRWGYNFKADAPTFTPSILARGGHYVPGQEGKDCWCTYEERIGRKSKFECFVCHSFVTDGQIKFLGDCTHALAGQTVSLPDIEE